MEVFAAIGARHAACFLLLASVLLYCLLYRTKEGKIPDSGGLSCCPGRNASVGSLCAGAVRISAHARGNSAGTAWGGRYAAGSAQELLGSACPSQAISVLNGTPYTLCFRQ